jgi:hypothetical protein
MFRALVTEYFPDQREKYADAQYRMSADYRAYAQWLPSEFHGLPPQVYQTISPILVPHFATLAHFLIFTFLVASSGKKKKEK